MLRSLITRLQRANRDLPRQLILEYVDSVYKTVAGDRTIYNRVRSDSTESGDPVITPNTREFDVSTIVGLEDVVFVDRVYSGYKNHVVDVDAYGSIIFFDESHVGNEYSIIAYRSGANLETEFDDINIPVSQIENFIQGVNFLIEVDQHGSYENWEYWNRRVRKKIYYAMNKQAYKKIRVGGNDKTESITPY